MIIFKYTAFQQEEMVINLYCRTGIWGLKNYFDEASSRSHRACVWTWNSKVYADDINHTTKYALAFGFKTFSSLPLTKRESPDFLAH